MQLSPPVVLPERIIISNGNSQTKPIAENIIRTPVSNPIRFSKLPLFFTHNYEYSDFYLYIFNLSYGLSYQTNLPAPSLIVFHESSSKLTQHIPAVLNETGSPVSLVTNSDQVGS